MPRTGDWRCGDRGVATLLDGTETFLLETCAVTTGQSFGLGFISDLPTCKDQIYLPLSSFDLSYLLCTIDYQSTTELWFRSSIAHLLPVHAFLGCFLLQFHDSLSQTPAMLRAMLKLKVNSPSSYGYCFIIILPGHCRCSAR